MVVVVISASDPDSVVVVSASGSDSVVEVVVVGVIEPVVPVVGIYFSKFSETSLSGAIQDAGPSTTPGSQLAKMAERTNSKSTTPINFLNVFISPPMLIFYIKIIQKYIRYRKRSSSYNFFP